MSPKADENLLELMVRIAENPSQWKQVHHMLREYRISIHELSSEVAMTAFNFTCCSFVAALFFYILQMLKYFSPLALHNLQLKFPLNVLRLTEKQIFDCEIIVNVKASTLAGVICLKALLYQHKLIKQACTIPLTFISK